MDLFLNAVTVVLQPENMFMVALGVFIGTLFGCIPGLTATLAIALLSPLTFNLEPIPAMIMLLGIFAGGMYGGSITAITLRTPGAPANAAAMLDGYPLTLQGKGGLAIGVSCFSGAAGGLISCAVMICFAPIIAKFALLFSPPEYFAVAFFGLTAVFAVSGSSLIKGFFATLLGLLFATAGYDPIFPIPRFAFGSMEMTKGLPFLPAVIGLFAFAEVFRLTTEYAGEKKYERIKIGRVIPTFKELLPLFPVMGRGGVWGTLIGILPGAGGTIAAYVAYGDAKRASKHPELFGTGILEGIAAPEAGNNAVTGGAVTPMLTLGIPGDSVTAILLGALTIQGIQPGPLLFTQHPDIVYPLFAGMVLSNIFLIFIGLAVVKPFSQLATIPKPLLISFLLVFGVMGALASGGVFEVWVALGFGVLGFYLERYGFPTAPLVLGLILGPLVENSLRQSLMLSDNNPMIFFTRPISCVFLLISAAIVGVIIYRRFRQRP
ncbi:C4-dicarboxylate ABC transporter permease [Deltaproteobacteria bacterium]|nr:C4-dicarboxylate ABC transporter permease [Deltaproteobacteria bacterium]